MSTLLSDKVIPVKLFFFIKTVKPYCTVNRFKDLAQKNYI